MKSIAVNVSPGDSGRKAGFDVHIAEGFEPLKELLVKTEAGKADRCKEVTGNKEGGKEEGEKGEAVFGGRKLVFIDRETEKNPVSEYFSQEGYSCESVSVPAGVIEEDKISRYIDSGVIFVLCGDSMLIEASVKALNVLGTKVDYIIVPLLWDAVTDISVRHIYNNKDEIFMSVPLFTYINIDVFKEMDNIPFYDGIAYVMRRAISQDVKFYVYLLDQLYEIDNRTTEAITDICVYAVNSQKKILDKECDGKVTLFRQLGTIPATAIYETSGSLSRGHALALGVICIAYMSWKKELLSMDEFYEFRDMFVPYNLPISIDKLDIEQAADKVMELIGVTSDNSFPLLKSAGKVVIRNDISREDVINALKEINFEDEY
ncbi:MAG: hypothetical protein K5662_08460 [Lachnospiraceae bacterium]|nr:hypothetical protein [Lachnospiraceae bacterium]